MSQYCFCTFRSTIPAIAAQIDRLVHRLFVQGTKETIAHDMALVAIEFWMRHFVRRYASINLQLLVSFVLAGHKQTERTNRLAHVRSHYSDPSDFQRRTHKNPRIRLDEKEPRISEKQHIYTVTFCLRNSILVYNNYMVICSLLHVPRR